MGFNDLSMGKGFNIPDDLNDSGQEEIIIENDNKSNNDRIIKMYKIR